MTKPIAIQFNDVHLKTGNEDAILKATKYMVSYAVDNSISTLIFAGDLFDSRSSQRQSALKTFSTMLDMIHEAKLKLYMFAGNHDKTVYKSYDSFLESFKHHPCVTYNKDVSDIILGGVSITLMPFFDDSMLVPKLEEHVGGDMLVSHFEMQGSEHLGNVSEKTVINKKLLSKWKVVRLGHYHNHVKISDKISHLPSFIQGDFGENRDKGFALLNDDLTYTLIKGDFTEYIKYSFDLDVDGVGKVIEAVEIHKNSPNVIRFEVSGSKEKLRAFDKSIFKDTGIGYKPKLERQYEELSSSVQEIKKKYGEADVKISFSEFCKKEGFDEVQGLELLNEFFKKDM